MKKTIVIADRSSYTNPSIEKVRLENTFCAFRNNHLSDYSNSLQWLICGNVDISNPAEHLFMKPEVYSKLPDAAVELGVSTPGYSASRILTNIRFASNNQIIPDLVIYSTESNEDFSDYEKTLTIDEAFGGMNNADTQLTRSRTILLNLNCCRYDIIIPQIIRILNITPNT